MKLVSALLFVAAFAIVSPKALYAASRAAAPQVPASQTAPDSEKLGQAMAIARLVQPPDLAVAAALPMLEKAFRQAVVAGAGKDAAVVEAENPGLIDGLWSAVTPVVTTYLNEQLPDLHDKLASLYASRLTESELDHVARFYAGPTGRKIVRQMHFGFDADPMVEEVIANLEKGGASDISANAFDAGTKGALRGLPALMTPADNVAFQALANNVPMAKLKSIGPDVQKLMVEWSNTEDPEFDRKLDAAMARYVENMETSSPSNARPKQSRK